jgi:hypothetical protein
MFWTNMPCTVRSVTLTGKPNAWTKAEIIEGKLERLECQRKRSIHQGDSEDY